MTITKYQINLNAQNSNFPLTLILSSLGRGWGEGGFGPWKLGFWNYLEFVIWDLEFLWFQKILTSLGTQGFRKS